jgi:hypothetical protein
VTGNSVNAPAYYNFLCITRPQDPLHSKFKKSYLILYSSKLERLSLSAVIIIFACKAEPTLAGPHTRVKVTNTLALKAGDYRSKLVRFKKNKYFFHF